MLTCVACGVSLISNEATHKTTEERRKNNSMEEVKTERGFDKLLLEYEIRSRGMTIDEFCENIGVSRAAYQFWAAGKSGDWTRGKITRAAEVLGLSGEQILKIFFVSIVD